ncbi:hypothetical protein JANAI62_28450 [Jannaschia pagri]|uniref:Uncharacterized protein n=1 Tax=Jannaschia pagri TaxID=2829797 RepID=A0ABQ4NQ66_9RHOB|nr:MULTISPECIES: hypothetical protein [unclassified Jannaschia]GIT92387.1 hypothetical protein JANAI61_28450 [Jannaschia sp. AI_61]GIT96222.1 hypothetical protein JANAI62_28450 [Jannaschia sp. AI_62]
MATLIGLLSLTTFGFVMAFAYIGKRAAERALRDGDVPRSTLCSTSEHWDPVFRAGRSL